METLKIYLPLPPSNTKPNARVHRWLLAKAKNEQRDISRKASEAAMRAHQITGNWPGACIIPQFAVKRKHDNDNLIAWLKATIDGLQDSHLLRDDRHVIFWPPTQIVSKETGLILVLHEWHGQPVSHTVVDRELYDECCQSEWGAEREAHKARKSSSRKGRRDPEGTGPACEQ